MRQTDIIFREAYAQLKPIFDASTQAVYLYLDDEHKACNKRFASLLGYASPSAWAAVQDPFPLAFVAPSSRRTLVMAYRDAMEQRTGQHIKVSWQKKTRGTVSTDVLLVPYAHKKHLFALHFVA